MKPYRLQIIVTIIIGIIKFAIPLLIPLLTKYVLDDIVTNSQLTADEKIEKLFFIMIIVGIVFVVLRPPIEYYRQYFAQWTANKILYDIRDRLFDHIQKLSFKYYSNTKTGEVISRVIHDVEETKSFVITGLMNIWLDMATIIIAIMMMFAMDVQLTIVSLILFPVYAFSVKYFFGNLRKLTRKRSQALAQVQSYLHERVQGMPVIQSFAVEDEEQKRFERQNKNFLSKAIEQTKWNAKAFAVVNTITDIAPLIVILFASYQAIQGNLTIGEMAAFIGLIDRLYSPLRRLVNASTTLTQSIASMDRVFDFVDETYDIEDHPESIECEHVNGEIHFNGVSFRYNDEDDNVLKNITLHVKKGETIAFVGMSGGGKSTLVSLIPRFYDVTEGKITIDGMDIRQFKVRSLRDKI